MPLLQIEVENFKSYRGHQVIGPFSAFSCVIGPNGAGKSNLMDAISFVLGVRSAQLRSTQLKDLIYRGGNKYLDEEENVLPNGDAMDIDLDDAPVAKSAAVTAVYQDKQGTEYRFTRSISASGSSEYRINGTVMTYAKYNAVLEKHNILVKAKNFLVFQGDVEAVAQQSPKDLSKLIEQISGSGDLKEEYDTLKVQAEKATENSTAAFNKRKGFNTEIKQFKEQKAEALRFDQLRHNRDEAIVKHCLWKLYHLEQEMEERQTLIQEKNKSIKTLRSQQTEHENKLKAARKEQAKAQKEVAKKEKELKRREKDYDDKKPELLSLEAQIAHSTKKIKNATTLESTVVKDREARAITLKQFERDLVLAQKASRQHAEEVRKASQGRGLTLSDTDLHVYRDLKAKANLKAVSERQKLDSSNRDLRVKKDVLTRLQDQLEQVEHKRETLYTEESALKPRKDSLEKKIQEISANLARVKKELQDMQAERTKANQLTTELNEKLQECYNKLMQAGADQRESDRDARLKEVIGGFQKSMPSKVLGRMMDLVKPTQRKYDTAVTVVLGRHIDSIVVDTEATAIACIQDMRNARAGIATFLPLDAIEAKPIRDKFRSYSKNARLAIDVVSFDNSVEKAVNHVCGNAMICDSTEVAKYVCYDKGQEVKAVTLDGTVFHKTGLISGGAAAATGGRKWDSAQIEGLKRLEVTIRSELAEVSKNKPRQSSDDLLTAEISRLEADLSLSKDDLTASKSRLNGLKSEQSVLKKKAEELSQKVADAKDEHEELAASVKNLNNVIIGAESSIFAEFCEKVGIANIAEYEGQALVQAQEEAEATLKFTTQISRLTHQIDFEREQLESFDARLSTITSTIKNETSNLDKRQAELTKAKEELEAIETELENMREELKALEDAAAARLNDAENVKKSANKSSTAYQKALKDISSWNDDIERFGSERFGIYRRCKLEEIDIPLSSGDLDSIPIEENLREAMPMDIDTEEDGTQKPVQIANYGIEVDFESLEDEERDDGSAEMENNFQKAITKLADEIQKMTPNMKANSKLDDVEAKLAATDKDFEASRRGAKDAKEAFADIRKRRTNLFMKAYSHISEKIDVVYKDLTKGKASPMGGGAYLSLEDSEEPYLHGIKYHAMPPMKRFRDMDQLSGGEKTMAALALLFAIHSFHPSPFFVLDEVDAALDNTNVGRIANYVRSKASDNLQFIVISLKGAFYEKARGLVGIWRDVEGGSSRTLTLDLTQYA